jgi:hypothetical protein
MKADNVTIDRLRNSENRLIMKAKLDTKPLGQNLKIYSDYFIRAKVTGDLKYRAKIR